MEHTLALTIKLLKGMGIDDEKIEAIIAAHTETTDGLKADRDKFKKQAEQVPDLQKQLEDAKAAAGDPDQWKAKYEAEHQAYEEYKGQVAADKAKASKADAYRKLLAEVGVAPNRIDTIMRVTDLDAVEIGDDGTIKDADTHKDAAKKEWADFIVKQQRVADPPADPPKGKPTVEGADPEVAKHMQERYANLYGKTESKE